MKKIIVLISFAILSFYSFTLKADLFGGDVGVLLKLAATSIKQLNELEKLVSKSEKHTQKIREYNEILQDKILFANQVVFKLERLKSLKKGKIKNLGELNRKIREIKWKIADFKNIMDDVGEDYAVSEHIKRESINQEVNLRKFKTLSEQQKSLSSRLNKSVSLNKANAMTNAYNLELNTLGLQVQTQNLHQNATQSQYIMRQYHDEKAREKAEMEFWYGKEEENYVQY